MKTPLYVLGMIFTLLIAGCVHDVDSTGVAVPSATVRTAESFVVTPNAVVVFLKGKCVYSRDGVDYAELSSKQLYPFKRNRSKSTAAAGVDPIFSFGQGTVIRTGEDSRVDLFFRRTGIAVRVQPDTEVKLETMSRSLKDGVPTLQTLLDLRAGRLFTVVRSAVPGSTLEIRNAVGRTVVEGGGGTGRYIITSDGTQVAAKNSTAPLKLIGATGVTEIAPGMKLSAGEGKLLPVEAPEAVKWLIEFDELDAVTEKWAQENEVTGQ